MVKGCVRDSLPSDLWGQYWGTSSDGRHVSIWCLCGTNAWAIAKRWIPNRLLVVHPPSAEPEIFDWSTLRGHPPILLYRVGEIADALVDRLAASMLRDGVERVSLLMSGGVTYFPGWRAEA